MKMWGLYCVHTYFFVAHPSVNVGAIPTQRFFSYHHLFAEALFFILQKHYF